LKKLKKEVLIGAMRTIQTLYQKALANYDNLRGSSNRLRQPAGKHGFG